MKRPDFLDGLGIYVGPQELALAAVSKRLFQVKVTATRVVPLPGRELAVERRAALVDAVRAFIAEHAPETGHAVLCLPRADAAVTRVLLPAAARENLSQVLEYEMENLVPLPREEVYFDHSMRPLPDDRLEVLLVCLPRDVIRGHLEALEEVGVSPRRIVLPSTALFDFVAFCGDRADRPIALVIENTATTEIALAAEGRLVGSQVVPGGFAADGAAVDRALARQLVDEGFDPDQTVVHRWSFVGPPSAGAGDDLVALARGKIEVADTFFVDTPPAILPAVGAALAAVREGHVTQNLLPEENREAFDEGPSVVTWVLLAASVVLFVVWGMSAIVKDVLLRNELVARLEAVGPEVREVKAVQIEIDDLQRQVDVLGAAQDGRVTTLLKDLTELIPTDAYLTSFNLRTTRLQLEGQARSASDIITALEKSKRFKNPAFSSPTTRQGDKERFTLTAEVVK